MYLPLFQTGFCLKIQSSPFKGKKTSVRLRRKGNPSYCWFHEILVLPWRTRGGLLFHSKLSHSSLPKSHADKTELGLMWTQMLEQKQKSVSLYFFPLTAAYLMLASKSSKQNSGDLIHQVYQVLFLNYPCFILKEWDYFLPYWKISLLPVYSHLFFLFYPKSMDNFKEKIKSKTNPNSWLSVSLVLFHFTPPSLHSTITFLNCPLWYPLLHCWPLLTYSLLVGSAGHLHNQVFVMLSDRLQVTILKQHTDCFLCWYSSSLAFRKTAP